MVEFFRTAMGHKFYEGTMPQVARALAEIARKMPEPSPTESAASMVIVIPGDDGNGEPWDYLLGIPQGMSVSQWRPKVNEILERAATAAGDGGHDEMFPLLDEMFKEAGFILPNWIYLEEKWSDFLEKAQEGGERDAVSAEQEGE